ncbi:hypothetical protein [Thalassococcus lentus]|uniref:Uncharacterized protein n=1 Tax=Thalassococcus lentus TaxID=1210524 RepID=A0ABT4XUE8_9RHOB|nr:hypothetical protein [Thalassococcus lentus]MDA7425590.1 hypothetical protein [Thalassococcus lentus]
MNDAGQSDQLDREIEEPVGSVFLQKQTYRRRRLADSARVLPVLGLLLWMVPLLWGASGKGQSASSALIYIFAVWGGLVVCAAFIILLLNRRDQGRAPDEGASREAGQ